MKDLFVFTICFSFFIVGCNSQTTKRELVLNKIKEDPILKDASSIKLPSEEDVDFWESVTDKDIEDFIEEIKTNRLKFLGENGLEQRNSTNDSLIIEQLYQDIRDNASIYSDLDSIFNVYAQQYDFIHGKDESND